MVTPDSDWSHQVLAWCQKRRKITPALAASVVSFFRESFDRTRCPDKAWFGVHKSGISLVAGGIYLSALNLGADRGVWMLLGHPIAALPHVDGVSYRPVKSARNPDALTWAHSESFDAIPAILASPDLWRSFEIGSERVLTESRSAGDRGAVHANNGKRKLSQFWFATDVFPDEVPTARTFIEGAVYAVTANAYERNPEARRLCIAAHEPKCAACGFDFGAAYGPEFAGFIHVHHIRPLSEIRTGYIVDPVNEMRPVCPNCHAILHHGGRLRTIAEVKDLLHRARTLEGDADLTAAQHALAGGRSSQG